MAKDTIAFPTKKELEGKYTIYKSPTTAVPKAGELPFPTTQAQMAEYQGKKATGEYAFEGGKWYTPSAPAPTITADDLTTPVAPVVFPEEKETDVPSVTPSSIFPENPFPGQEITAGKAIYVYNEKTDRWESKDVGNGVEAGAVADDTSDYLKAYLKDLEPPTDPTVAYKEAEEEAGIEEKGEAFIEAQREVKAAQSELDFINADIARMVGETQVRKLQIAKEPISAGAIAGRNIVEERRLAIRAIPLQAQALVAQAKIASAQGDEIIAQNTLKMAQDRLDRVFDMQLDYSENLRNYNNDLRAMVYDIASAKEKRELDAQEKADDRAFTLMRDQIDYAQSVAKSLLQTQPDLAAKISQIDWSKPDASDKFARLQGQVTPEVGKIGTQVVEVGGRKLLINTQTGATIRDLGAADGIPDISGITTLTGKPLSDTQALTFGYGTRMSNANVIISELEDEFTGAIGIITGHKWFPGVFKTDDRLRIEQAERNFINAVLRRESGAAIAPSEFDSAAKQYFPQPGDSPEVLDQKAANRKTVISNFAIAANVPLSEITGQEETPTGEGSYKDYLKAIK